MNAIAAGVLDAALTEVKAWLRIELSTDDGSLASLIRAAFAHTEDFCGQVLLVRNGVETLPMRGEWTRMSATPVRAITQVSGLPAEGSSFLLSTGSYAIDIDANGDGWIRVTQPGSAGRIAVQMTAGLANDWASLPEAIRQGVVRLAAHMFAERDSGVPPAIVTALWQPWRRMRLS
jgi:uncharacterized phiE125 gp8 family phage protein